MLSHEFTMHVECRDILSIWKSSWAGLHAFRPRYVIGRRLEPSLMSSQHLQYRYQLEIPEQSASIVPLRSIHVIIVHFLRQASIWYSHCCFIPLRSQTIPDPSLGLNITLRLLCAIASSNLMEHSVPNLVCDSFICRNLTCVSYAPAGCCTRAASTLYSSRCPGMA